MEKWKIFSKKLTFIFAMLILFSCSEKETTKPNEVFKYWSGSNETKEIKLIKGHYWQSAHWTREYIMSLKFRPTKNWWSSFVEQNNLVQTKEEWIKPSDLPNWFKPSQGSIQYKTNENFDQGSRYFCDYNTGICYIYEIQL